MGLGLACSLVSPHCRLAILHFLEHSHVAESLPWRLEADQEGLQKDDYMQN